MPYVVRDGNPTLIGQGLNIISPRNYTHFGKVMFQENFQSRRMTEIFFFLSECIGMAVDRPVALEFLNIFDNVYTSSYLAYKFNS